MNTVGLLIVLEAKAGTEDDLASFLTGALPLVQQEPETTAWFAARLGPARFAIFDAFRADKAQDAHLAGQVAAALMDHAPELLAQAPSIEQAEILAEKPPKGPGVELRSTRWRSEVRHFDTQSCRTKGRPPRAAEFLHDVPWCRNQD